MATVYNSAQVKSYLEQMENLLSKDAPKTQEKADKRIQQIDDMKKVIPNLKETLLKFIEDLEALPAIDKSHLPTQAEYDMAQRMQPLWDKVAELKAQKEPRNNSLNGEIVQLVCERGNEFAGAVLGGLYEQEANGATDDPKWSDNHLHEYVNTLENLIKTNQDKVNL